MFLQPSNRREDNPDRMVCEFLHSQIDFSISDWHAAGNLVGYTHQPVTGDLEEQRRDHLRRLESKYDPGQVRHWMYL